MKRKTPPPRGVTGSETKNASGQRIKVSTPKAPTDQRPITRYSVDETLIVVDVERARKPKGKT
jgi:hypothetical protein